PVPSSFTALGALPWNGVVVCGFDDLWDRALTTGPEPFRPLRDGQLADSGAARFLVRALGATDAPDTLCLSPRDARDGVRQAVAAFLRQRFREETFVFLGFAPDDPDLTLLVHGLLGGAPTWAEHFLVVTGAARLGPERLEAAGAGLGLTVLPVDGAFED